MQVPRLKRRRGEVHLKEGLTRVQLEDIESVTEQALRWLAAHLAEDVFSAGRLFRISPSTITRGLAARRLRPVCVKCGQVVRKGFAGSRDGARLMRHTVVSQLSRPNAITSTS